MKYIIHYRSIFVWNGIIVIEAKNETKAISKARKIIIDDIYNRYSLKSYFSFVSCEELKKSTNESSYQ